MRLEQDAYTTILLHCAKYPAAAVNGILLGTYDGPRNTVVTRAVPLQHHWTHLSPMVETGLSLVNASIASPLQIVGVYYAPSDLASSQRPELNATATKIAQTIAAKLSGDAIAIQVNNAALSSPNEHALVAFSVPSPSAQAKSVSQAQVDLAGDGTVAKAKQAIARGAWRSLYDFDDHLEDTSLDWLNPIKVA